MQQPVMILLHLVSRSQNICATVEEAASHEVAFQDEKWVQEPFSYLSAAQHPVDTSRQPWTGTGAGQGLIT